MATAARPPGHLWPPAAGDDASDPFVDALLAPLAAKMAGASRQALTSPPERLISAPHAARAGAGGAGAGGNGLTTAAVRIAAPPEGSPDAGAAVAGVPRPPGDPPLQRGPDGLTASPADPPSADDDDAAPRRTADGPTAGCSGEAAVRWRDAFAESAERPDGHAVTAFSEGEGGGKARPPAGSDPADRPRPGERCGRCRGARWWCEAVAPKGWRCVTCHPPPAGLGPAEIAIAP
jgi:hypothetical protein